MSRKKRSLKERLVGLVVVLVVASVWFAFRRSLDSEKEIVKPANKTVLAEKSDTKAECEPKDDGSAWYSAEDEMFYIKKSAMNVILLPREFVRYICIAD